LGQLGLEPRTIRLKAEYSTIELLTHPYLLYKIFIYLTIPKIFFQAQIINLQNKKSFDILYCIQVGSVAQLVRAGDS
jgi:hypothetical protein